VSGCVGLSFWSGLNHDITQKDLDRLEESDWENLLKSNKTKHKVLHLDQGNLQC